jgi:hypothetical protein
MFRELGKLMKTLLNFCLVLWVEGKEKEQKNYIYELVMHKMKHTQSINEVERLVSNHHYLGFPKYC